MLPLRFLKPGEQKLAWAPVFWTDAAAARPSRSGSLYCTNQRLILAKPRLRPLLLFGVWPIVGVVGLACAGLPGAMIGFAVLLALHLGLPSRPVMIVPFAEVSRCTLLPSTGWRKFVEREIVEIAATDGRAWRLSTVGRNQTSAAPIIEALREVQIEVVS